MEIIKSYTKATNYLKNGKIGIIPTDTIYGLSCLTSSEENVEKIYKIKQRDYSKPFIILISSIQELKQFEILLSEAEENILKKYWPGPVSIILNVSGKEYKYLHRGMGTIAFRLPKHKDLLSIIKVTGPIVSTSANISDFQPINSVPEAQKLFKDKVNFMLDRGSLENKPSKIIRIENNTEKIIR